MKSLSCGLMICAMGLMLASPRLSAAQEGIVIRDAGPPIPYRVTNNDAGPTDLESAINNGNILNAHYYPGLNFYSRANYRDAKNQMDYVIARPTYIEKNPKASQILSVAYFIRGSIYFRHASGLGRLNLAKNDLEESIKLNSGNYLARLELARLTATLNQKPEAITMLDELLKAPLTANLRQEAQTDLQALKAGTFKPVTSE